MGGLGTTAALEVWRPAGATYNLVGLSNQETVSADGAVHTFVSPSIAANAGDVLGLDVLGEPGVGKECAAKTDDSGDLMGLFQGPPPAIGAAPDYLVPEVGYTSDVHALIGLKNSDDQGTQFDVQTELLKNGTPVDSGLKRCITGATRNPSLAKDAVVPWLNPTPSVPLSPGDVLTLRVSTRIGTNTDGSKCAGPGGSHNNAVGLRLYYDSASQKSRFDATITPNASQDWYLHSNGNACANAESTSVTSRFSSTTIPTGASAKCKDSASVNYAGGNSFKVVGEWSLTI